MKAKRVAGAALVLSPLVGIFGLMCYKGEFLDALAVFGTTALILVVVWIGVSLLLDR